MNRCDEHCKYPCAKDHRTKAEKIAAMRAGATTPGERAAADAAAARHPLPPKPKPPTYTGPIHSYTSNSYTSGSGAKARFWDMSEYAQFVRQMQREYEAEMEAELLRRAQGAETLRRKRTMPDDTKFEEE